MGRGRPSSLLHYCVRIYQALMGSLVLETGWAGIDVVGWVLTASMMELGRGLKEAERDRFGGRGWEEETEKRRRGSWMLRLLRRQGRVIGEARKQDAGADELLLC